MTVDIFALMESELEALAMEEEQAKQAKDASHAKDNKEHGWHKPSPLDVMEAAKAATYERLGVDVASIKTHQQEQADARAMVEGNKSSAVEVKEDGSIEFNGRLANDRDNLQLMQAIKAQAFKKYGVEG